MIVGGTGTNKGDYEKGLVSAVLLLHWADGWITPWSRSCRPTQPRSKLLNRCMYAELKDWTLKMDCHTYFRVWVGVILITTTVIFFNFWKTKIQFLSFSLSRTHTHHTTTYLIRINDSTLKIYIFSIEHLLRSIKFHGNRQFEFAVSLTQFFHYDIGINVLGDNARIWVQYELCLKPTVNNNLRF